MADKELIEVLSAVKDIQAKLNVANLNIRGPVADPAPTLRGPIADPAIYGPVADPAPDWINRLRQQTQVNNPWRWIMGPVADPAPGPDVLLPKDKLAKIKIFQIESTITQLQKEIEGLNLQKDLLKQEFNIK